MRSLIKQVAKLVQEGWRPYDAKPKPEVYERLECPNASAKSRKRPCWFVRGDIFCCIACERTCSLVRPKGFPPALPINYPQPPEPFMLTPQEMVARRHTLNVREVAYCLNVSERRVYTMIAEGELVALRGGKPLRVRASDVAKAMEDFDE